MKIAVITLPLHTNYGGILQAYALQRVLEGLGHQVQTLRFAHGAAYKLYHPVSVWLKQRGLIPYSHNYPLSSREHAALRCNTDEFVNEYIKLTVPLPAGKIAREGFDAFVVGSDQVWRHFNERYFLGFLPVGTQARKIAYAASFGIDRWSFTEQQAVRAKELLARFDAVSVREDSAVKMCTDRLGVQAVQTLDPALLPDKEDYMALAAKKLPAGALQQQNLLMSYILDNNPAKDDLVRQVARKLGLAVNSVVPEARPARGIDIENCVWPSVEEWIAGFASARFVVTDSFHGTALAILFNKPFVAICNDARGSTRFHSLLRMFSLEGRLVNAGEHRLVETGENRPADAEKQDEQQDSQAERQAIESLISTEIDFTGANEILAEQRAKSLEFLRNML